MSKKKVKVTLLTAVNSRNAGGLFNSVKSLGFSLKDKFNLSILSYDDEYSKEDIATYKGLRVQKYKVLPSMGLGLSFNLYRKLHIESPKIIHQQGIWMFFSFIANRYKNKTGVKQVIAPRGMLDPWALSNSNWKKRMVGSLFENRNLRQADCIHALCESEYRSIRKYGLTNPVAIIPNGFNLREEQHIRKENNSTKTILFIGRIHPKKGLKELIHALNKLKNSSEIKNWKLKIAGWSQMNHEEELKELVRLYGLNKRIEFIGPIFGIEKVRELESADVFILPSFSEGLPMAVLEAWSFGLPALITDECNLPEGFMQKAAYRITTDPKSMSEQILNFFKLSDEERSMMGNRALNLLKNQFTWDIVGEKTNQMYNWLLDKADKPEFVKLD
ncbi:glycosyltransferase [Tamlana sp. s12]|uniref:glycosyltransferase n=1 Tax=Tamlana sp. s12 TaxID=1630406 RepID=UPI0007FC2E8B|nr:glycosyltransferase [Tamlana sp. s12]OBQ55587.1 hypothetical protein VQ01_09125 [Tamlana sp. s12]QQY83734.1 glycosyltransferase [Tamlana sp. s12]